MRSHILYRTLLAFSIILPILQPTTIEASNTNIGLVILGSGETLSGSIISYFPQFSGTTNTGMNNTGSQNTGVIIVPPVNQGGGGGTNNVEIPVLPPATIGPILPVGTGDKIIVDSGVVLPQPSAPIFTGMIDAEMIAAYERAKSKGITTMPTWEKARLDKPLLRSELAKMMVNFAINTLEKDMKIDPICDVNNFKDAYKMDTEERRYIEQACSLHIMGWKNDKKAIIEYFNPHKPVTRAEFGTVLSRLLYGETHNGDLSSDGWYKKHLQALQKDGIMKKIDTPLVNEIRGYVFIMLHRLEK